MSSARPASLNASADSVPANAIGLRSTLDRFGLSIGDALILCWVAGFFLVFGWPFAYPGWTPRFVMVLLVLPAGLSSIVALARRRDRPAIAALAIVVWSVAVGLVSAAPLLSLKGMYGRENSVLLLAAAFAAWGLGRELGDTARKWLGDVVVACLGLSLVVGVLQLALEINSGSLVTFSGRASGLLNNPVYFGAWMAAAVCHGALRKHRQPGPFGIVVVALGSFGLMLSGSRVALVAMVLVLAWGIRRFTVRRAVQVVVGIAVGALAGIAFSRVVHTDTAVGRLSIGGTSGRLSVWRYGMDALADQPIQGWGLGLYRQAVQSRFSETFARELGRDETQPWFDPHNVVLLLLVGTGVVGFAIACYFGVEVVRRARGSLAAMFCAIALTWLLQPASINVAPLAMLLLGASMTARQATPYVTVRRIRPSMVVSVLVGIGVAGYVGYADHRLNAALRSEDPARIVDAAGFFPHDATIANLIAYRLTAAIADDPAFTDDALDWAGKVVEIEPTYPYWWNRDASLQILFGDLDGAKRSLDRAIELEPNNPLSWVLMRTWAVSVGEEGLVTHANDRVCALSPRDCHAD